MSDRKTKTGFDIKITGFLEFHVNDLFETAIVDPRKLTDRLKEVMAEYGVENVKLDVKHRDRKTIETNDGS